MEYKWRASFQQGRCISEWECKIMRANSYHGGLILYFPPLVWLAALCFSLCHICLTCFHLTFHLRNIKKKRNDLTELYLCYHALLWIFPLDILGSSSDLSQWAWIPLNMFLRSDLFLPPSIPPSLFPSYPSPRLPSFLEYLLRSDLMKEFN